MKNLLIIQARMGSTRLPGKVLMDIGGRTMLERVVGRARRSKQIDDVVVATSSSEKDDVVAEHARSIGADVFRGHESDVLNRYYSAAREYNATVVTRVTADCPLIDPEIIDKVLKAFLGRFPEVDFAANTLQRTYPRGMDVEVASFESLERASQEAHDPYERAHVFPYIYQHPERFRLVSVTDVADHSMMRWTVDTDSDLDFVRAVYRRFDNREDISWRDIIAMLEREPELLEINRNVRQKALNEG